MRSTPIPAATPAVPATLTYETSSGQTSPQQPPPLQHSSPAESIETINLYTFPKQDLWRDGAGNTYWAPAPYVHYSGWCQGLFVPGDFFVKRNFTRDARGRSAFPDLNSFVVLTRVLPRQSGGAADDDVPAERLCGYIREIDSQFTGVGEQRASTVVCRVHIAVLTKPSFALENQPPRPLPRRTQRPVEPTTARTANFRPPTSRRGPAHATQQFNFDAPFL